MKYLLASKDSQESADATVQSLKKAAENLKDFEGDFSVAKEDTRFKVFIDTKALNQADLDGLRSMAQQVPLKIRGAKERMERAKNIPVGANQTLGGQGGGPPAITAG